MHKTNSFIASDQEFRMHGDLSDSEVNYGTAMEDTNSSKDLKQVPLELLFVPPRLVNTF